MKTTYSLLIAASAVLLATSVLVLEPQAQAKRQEPKAALSDFMRQKLDASNQILEGLVTEDFELVGKGASELQELSTSEEWRISNDALYRQYSAEFLRIVQRLEKSAKDKKLEGSTLIWIEATMGCIECHKHARSILIAAN